MNRYIGRFAPSPTGPLHRGSVVAALASWLDARAHRGLWRVRIEDLDEPRCVAGADAEILATLRALGLHWDGEVIYQSQRGARYQAAFDRLQARGLAYPCACSRREIEDSLAPRSASGERPYPGTCRAGLPTGRVPRAWRLRTDATRIEFIDRLAGAQAQCVGAEVGDFVVRRADGLWAYQLAVVVDDAEQQITDVVRGADLLGSTARQRWLQAALELPTPRMMHVPVVVAADGTKLSKQNGAVAVDAARPVEVLDEAFEWLGFKPPQAGTAAQWLADATHAWATRFVTC